MGLLLVYLVGINLITFVVYGIDKVKAKRQRWRVRESTLILLALLGGSVGAALGMKVWRHKTRHRKFSIGIPAILIAQTCLAVYTLMFLQ